MHKAWWPMYVFVDYIRLSIVVHKRSVIGIKVHNSYNLKSTTKTVEVVYLQMNEIAWLASSLPLCTTVAT